MLYHDYILSADEEIIRKIQIFCADIESDNDGEWTRGDATFIAALLNKSEHPTRLFRFIDEKTGSTYVGYRTRDGREWFHILRQMRNEVDSGLLENLRGDWNAA
jgi:hypothetical protein